MDFSDPTHQPLKPGQRVATSGEILAYSAGVHGHRTAIICDERHWTYAALNRAANRFANAVISNLAGSDGPIAICGHNAVEYAIAHFGTARTGRCTVNLPTRCTDDELISAIRLTRPAMVITDDAGHERVEDLSNHFEGDPRRLSYTYGFPEFLETAPDTAPEVEIDPDAPGSVIFTGGTTGLPKAVVSSQRARAVSAMAALEDFRIKAGEVAGFSVPFTHTAGLFSWFQPAMLAGVKGVIIPAWSPEAFMAMAERHAIEVIFAVPAQLAMLLDDPGFAPERLQSMRRMVFGGAPLPRALIERAEAALPWMDCERAYGSTETGHLAAQIKADRNNVYDGYNQPGGRLEIDIFKSPGVRAAIGEVGELATRGAHLMTGYLGNSVENAAFFKTAETEGDWGWTGDLAVRHDGYFSLVGRSKHIIISGGLNIYPIEIEEVLASHPDVADCAVVGLADETWGELPVAAVAPRRSRVDADAMLDFVAGKVARHKRPRRILLVDRIPRTLAGKIDAGKVKALF